MGPKPARRKGEAFPHSGAAEPLATDYGRNHLHYLTASTYRKARIFDSDRYKGKLLKLEGEGCSATLMGGDVQALFLPQDRVRIDLGGAARWEIHAQGRHGQQG